jgi:hypothetical protein
METLISIPFKINNFVLLNHHEIKRIFSFLFILLPSIIFAQTISQKLQSAFTKFEKDPQLAYAISSL